MKVVGFKKIYLLILSV